jgi:putative redox protein
VSSILIRSTGVGTCRVVHEPSGASFATDMPPEYGGGGRSFSATDLLAAALGVCIATNLDAIAERHGIPLDALSVRVDKTLATSPKRVERLTVTIAIDAPVAEDVLVRLERAAEHCTVHRSLHPEVAVDVVWQTGAA